MKKWLILLHRAYSMDNSPIALASSLAKAKNLVAKHIDGRQANVYPITDVSIGEWRHLTKDCWDMYLNYLDNLGTKCFDSYEIYECDIDILLTNI